MDISTTQGVLLSERQDAFTPAALQTINENTFADNYLLTPTQVTQLPKSFASKGAFFLGAYYFNDFDSNGFSAILKVNATTYASSVFYTTGSESIFVQQIAASTTALVFSLSDNTLRVSSDGIGTLPTNNPAGGLLNVLIWDGVNNFVGVSGNTVISSGASGDSFTTRTGSVSLPPESTLGRLIYTGTTYVGSYQSNVIYRTNSLDTNWTPVDVIDAGTGEIRGLVWSASRSQVIAVGARNSLSFIATSDTSANAFTVSTITTTIGTTFIDVAVNGSNIYLLASFNAGVLGGSSFFGYPYLTTNLTSFTRLSKVTAFLAPYWLNNRYVNFAATGETLGTISLATSNDLINFTDLVATNLPSTYSGTKKLVSNGTTNLLISIIATGGGSATNPIVYFSSTNALTSWATTTISATTNSLNDIAFGAGIYVAVLNAGEIRSSPTGADGTWTTVASGVSANLVAIAFVAGTGFVIAGSGGVILTSPTGVTFTSRASGTTQNLISVGFSSTAILVGGSTVILRSTDLGVSWLSTTYNAGPKTSWAFILFNPIEGNFYLLSARTILTSVAYRIYLSSDNGVTITTHPDSNGYVGGASPSSNGYLLNISTYLVNSTMVVSNATPPEF